MVSYWKEIQKKSYSLAKLKWGYVIPSLYKLLDTLQINFDGKLTDLSKLMKSKVMKMINEFDLFLKQAVV